MSKNIYRNGKYALQVDVESNFYEETKENISTARDAIKIINAKVPKAEARLSGTMITVWSSLY